MNKNIEPIKLSPKFEVEPKVKNGIYKHYKGALYQVLNVGLDSESHKQVVVYKSIEHGTIWVRDEEMFLEVVEIESKFYQRFTFIRDL